LLLEEIAHVISFWKAILVHFSLQISPEVKITVTLVEFLIKHSSPPTQMRVGFPCNLQQYVL
jgi:hypothetical protein